MALGGTSFAAANYISGSKIAPHSIPKNRLTNKAIAQLKGNRGQPGTARAHGWVNRFTAAPLDPGHSKNVKAVTNPTAGIYCIQMPQSIDVSSTVLLTTPDYEHSDPFSGAIVAYVCPEIGLTACKGLENTFAVVTGYEGVSAGPPASAQFHQTNESFHFAVP